MNKSLGEEMKWSPCRGTQSCCQENDLRAPCPKLLSKSWHCLAAIQGNLQPGDVWEQMSGGRETGYQEGAHPSLSVLCFPILLFNCHSKQRRTALKPYGRVAGSTLGVELVEGRLGGGGIIAGYKSMFQNGHLESMLQNGHFL